MPKRIIAIALSTTFIFNGCATIADYKYTYVSKLKSWASWQDAKDCLPAERINHDFGKGYRAGFLDVTKGGDGTPPPVAPKEYWQAKYGCGSGNPAVHDWYQGFAYGASVALRCNYNVCYQVPAYGGNLTPSSNENCCLEANQVIFSAARGSAEPPPAIAPADQPPVPPPPQQPPQQLEQLSVPVPNQSSAVPEVQQDAPGLDTQPTPSELPMPPQAQSPDVSIQVPYPSTVDALTVSPWQ